MWLDIPILQHAGSSGSGSESVRLKNSSIGNFSSSILTEVDIAAKDSKVESSRLIKTSRNGTDIPMLSTMNKTF